MQYVENNFTGRQNGYQMFFLWVFAGKSFFSLLKTILQSGLVPVVSGAIVFVSVAGYVTAINYGMARGVSLKQAQTEIKLVETAVLQRETVLANARTIAALKKQKEVALMEDVGNVYYVSQNVSVAEASRDQVIR